MLEARPDNADGTACAVAAEEVGGAGGDESGGQGGDYTTCHTMKSDTLSGRGPKPWAILASFSLCEWQYYVQK